MTKSEKIDQIVEEIEQSTNFGIMKEMKEVLNKVFGEANNQLVKPNYFSMKRIAYEEGILTSFLNMSKCPTEDFRDYLKAYSYKSLCYQILIKFPQVEITNGEHKHMINDLYVRIFIRPNGTMVGNIYGIRGKLSINEVRSYYSHSHLPSCCPIDLVFEQFCTGTGPINQVIMLLGTSFSKPNFMMFCLHLKVFVAWESKEGRPHMYIENINTINRNEHYFLHESHAREAADHLFRSMKNLGSQEILSFMDYNVLPTKITIQMNETFEKWAANQIRSWDIDSVFPGMDLEIDCFLNTKDINGRYYSIPRDTPSRSLYDSEKVLLQFKGEDIKLQVEIPENPVKETIKDEEKVPNELITKNVGKKLTDTFSQAAFSNARIRAGCAGTHNPEVTRSNYISM